MKLRGRRRWRTLRIVPRGHAPFAVFNKTGNRVVRWLLQSPAHGVVSGRLALITVTGRRSGRRFTFPVGYRQDGDEVTIGVEWPDRKVWWRNLRGAGAPVSLKLRGAEREGHAMASEKNGGVMVKVRLEPEATRP
jgi:hypothetical protein